MSESIPLNRKRKADEISGPVSDEPEERSFSTTTTTTITTNPPDPPSSSRLLNLPAELRNKIYRYALVEPRAIPIRDHATLPRDPGLLKVSRQIRREASSIYHQENIFKVYIVDFDSVAYRRWYNSSVARKTSRKEYVIREARHWRNLKAWLRAYYYEESSKPGRKRSGKACVNASLFNLVQRMKKVHNMAWEEVEANLEDLHEALVAMDARWG